MENIFHHHDQCQSGEHGKTCPLQIHKGRITDDARIGVEQPETDNIEEEVKAKGSKQQSKILNGMQSPVI